MTKQLLFWSCRLEVINGQNIVTKRVLSNMMNNYQLKHLSYKSGAGGILSVFKCYIKLFFYLKSVDIFYIVVSRSAIGFLRDLPILVIARLIGKPFVCHAHGSDLPDLFLTPLIGRLALFLYQNATIVVPSCHLINDLKQFNLNKVFLLENFFNVGSKGKYIKKPGMILWNSNLIASKGLFEFLDFAKFCFEAKNSYRFVAIGKFIGDKTSTKKEVIRRLDEAIDNKWIEYRGIVSVEESINLSNQAEVVFLYSHYKSECQPIAVIQAMCQGCKLIIAPTSALKSTVGSYPCIYFNIEQSYDNLIGAISQVQIPTQEIVNSIERFSSRNFDLILNNIFYEATNQEIIQRDQSVQN